MRALERAVENLRPLVETKKWDFCVVWKLGDDPSRFIEWMGCCCAGGYGEHLNVKEERGGEKHLLAFCRDAYIQHPIRTKACKTLAQFPSSMPLYSGIHGEVVLSNQPRWLSHGNTSNSNNEHESMGTQVLIPVVGGLIELFSVKHIPKDQKIIEFMMAQYDISMEQEAMTAHNYTNVSLNDKLLHPLLDANLNYWTAPLNYLSLIPKLQDLPQVSQTSTYPSFEGSSTSSDRASRKVSPDKSIGKYAMCQNPNCNEINSVMQCANHAPEKDNFKVRKRTEREQYHSKNLVTERNRRNRIKDGLFTLRSLVPKISKMDRASILGDAVDYMEELQKRVKKLQDELKEMEEEDSKENNAKLDIKELKGVGKTYSPATPRTQGFSSADEQKEAEVQVEVNQIGTNDFLLKFCCEQKRGGFARLMEAMNSLGIQVVDANVTTFNGKVLNILKVEAKKSEVQRKNLKDSLIKLSRSQTVDRKSTKRS